MRDCTLVLVGQNNAITIEKKREKLEKNVKICAQDTIVSIVTRLYNRE